jgi:hypothetical protein
MGIVMKARSVRAWFAAIVVPLIGGTASQAEDIEITHCYSASRCAFSMPFLPPLRRGSGRLAA